MAMERWRAWDELREGKELKLPFKPTAIFRD